ncbi:MAG: Gfo/Idh/MocA family oxidoreductase [Lentisphaeraceae bacterium]|nr:Gfo/Idh/MocA family oxidoreductase [Lentisphaeraceae bacterium]
MKRRHFLLSSPLLLSSTMYALDENAKYKVAVIGHTGRGDYGHGLDYIWNSIDTTKITAVADANDKGLEKAKKKLKVDNGFTDYRKMLETTKPDIVAVCPRHADQHADMIKAAILHGAKAVYTEKPYCRTPREADQISVLAEKHNCKIAVAHRNRYHPVLKTIDKLIEDGAIGKVLEIRGRGKGDKRGGCEDLWVLGSHVLNLINYFAGTPLTCSSSILQDKELASVKDWRKGPEGLGQILGNEVHARYEMDSGISCYFDSIANDRAKGNGFGLKIIGSEGIIQIFCDRNPLAYYIEGNPFDTSAKKPVPISTAGIGKKEVLNNIHKRVFDHTIPALDLIESIEQDRAPVCDHKQGAMTVEMVMAALSSHVLGRRVKLHLESKEHPRK